MKDFFETLVTILLMCALIAGFVWLVVQLGESAKDLGESMQEKQEIKAHCYDRGYPGLKWANGKYYCYRKATGEIVAVDMPQ